MLIEDMYELVVLESGQFQIDETRLEISQELFRKQVPLVLSIYNKHKPRTERLYVKINDSRQYTFTEQNTPQGIPEWIADLIPIRLLGTYPFLLRDANTFGEPISYLQVKDEYPWVYRKPQLTIPVSGEFDLLAVYNHQITKDSNQLDQVTSISSEEDEVFFEMLTGKFMVALGRARRSFHLEGLPISDDGSDLATEGRAIYDEAFNKLITNKQKWYLAWG